MSRLHAHYFEMTGRIKRKAWNVDGATGELGDESGNMVPVLTPASGKRLVLFSIQYITNTNTTTGALGGAAIMRFGPNDIATKHLGTWTAQGAANGGNIPGVNQGPHYFKWGAPRVGNVDEALYMASNSTAASQPTVILDYVEF
jgi:hypothetical protein